MGFERIFRGCGRVNGILHGDFMGISRIWDVEGSNWSFNGISCAVNGTFSGFQRDFYGS